MTTTEEPHQEEPREEPRHEAAHHHHEAARQRVNTCALHALVLIWLGALLSVVVARFGLARRLELSEENLLASTWIVFVLVATTIVWTVLARAVGGRARAWLFGCWVASLLALFVWNALLTADQEVMLVFLAVAALGFLAVSAASAAAHTTSTRAAAAVYLAVPAAVAALGAYAATEATGRPARDFAPAAAASGVYVALHAASIWFYLHRAPHVWMVDNTCMFAVMSPFTEAVDTFASFGSCT
jgi:hypothetical protein